MASGWLEREPDPVQNDPHALLGGHRHRAAGSKERIVPVAESELVAVQHLEPVIEILHAVAGHVAHGGLLARRHRREARLNGRVDRARPVRRHRVRSIGW